MPGHSFSSNELLTMGARTTASFTPQAVTDTTVVSLQLVKASGAYDGGVAAGSTINTIKLYGSNADIQGTHGRWPSGSMNNPYWVQLTGSDLVGALANVCATAPLTSGTLGSAQITVSGFGMKWLKTEVLSNTGGSFSLFGFGKD